MELMMTWEQLGNLEVAVSPSHRPMTDSVLLADFSRPVKKTLAVDLCSGCGIIPLYWMATGNFQGDAYALEIQQDAVGLMQQTAARYPSLGFQPVLADLRDPLPPRLKGASLVTCNPPYGKQGHGRENPNYRAAQARHELSCSFEEICKAASGLLKEGGRFCFCHQPHRLPDLIEALRKYRLEPKRLQFIQHRPSSKPWLFLMEARKGGGSFLEALPALVLYDQSGNLNGKASKIYGIGKIGTN